MKDVNLSLDPVPKGLFGTTKDYRISLPSDRFTRFRMKLFGRGTRNKVEPEKF
jgi:hypothetical protein